MPPADGKAQRQLTLSNDLWDRIKTLAKAERRTASAEVELAIERHLDEHEARTAAAAQ